MTTKLSHRNAWKHNERVIAKYIGHAERVPITGRIRGNAPDIRHPWLSIEAKLRMRIPSWIKNGMDQAEKSAVGHQMPVLIIREKGQRAEDALICTTLREFRKRYL